MTWPILLGTMALDKEEGLVFSEEEGKLIWGIDKSKGEQD
jgi:hypothetical protein